jgi:hypothetical protein
MVEESSDSELIGAEENTMESLAILKINPWFVLTFCSPAWRSLSYLRPELNRNLSTTPSKDRQRLTGAITSKSKQPGLSVVGEHRSRMSTITYCHGIA